ncbi:MAG TPA: TetR/AcrR family transcriptional regulator [Ilumatobacter sp.]|nr:TetR/AcrR family transcriptional regulator [Ilumatobacter sp.]
MAKAGDKRSDSAADAAARPRYDGRREKIIELAVEVFATEGFKAGTTTEIARRAGLTQPAIYHYVGSKNALLVEICHRMGLHLQAVLDDVLARDELSSMERLRHFIDGYARAVMRDPGAMSVRATEARHLPAKMLKKIHAEERAYLSAIEQLVAAARDDGHLPADLDPWIATRALLGMMNWTYIWYGKGSGPGEDAVVDTILALALGEA